MIYTVTMNPAIDKTAEVDKLVVGGLNRLHNTMMNAGGKGINVSKTIQAFGGVSEAHGFVAGMNGGFIKSELDALHISHDMVEVDGNTRVNMKVLNKAMELTELNEEGPIIAMQDIDSLVNGLLKKIKSGDYVVLSGSVPTGVPANIYQTMCTKLKAQGAKVVLDADGELFKYGLQAGPNVIKPNTYELCLHFGLRMDCDEQTLIQHGKKLLAQGLDLMVISMGKDGAIFMNDTHVIKAKGLNIKAHSSVGAGDAMVAAVTYGLSEGYDFEKLVRFAVATSAGAVMTKGTQPPTNDVIEKLMKDVQLSK